MEYTLCQGEYKNPLILSEYCGTTSSMRSAVRINPWDLGVRSSSSLSSFFEA